ncbi:hypothetical protein EDD85DRAFT_796116 [Armillaria nabsnona]|nr:hypothetical protein EDD85DRAFT_796116 [Armillaria nabsnona]
MTGDTGILGEGWNLARVVPGYFGFPVVAQFLPMVRLVLIQSRSRKRVTVLPFFVTSSTPIDKDTAEGGFEFEAIQTPADTKTKTKEGGAETRPIYLTEISRAREAVKASKSHKGVEDHDDSVPKAVSGTFIIQYLLAVLSFPVFAGGSQTILSLILLWSIFVTGRTAIDKMARTAATTTLES